VLYYLSNRWSQAKAAAAEESDKSSADEELPTNHNLLHQRICSQGG